VTGRGHCGLRPSPLRHLLTRGSERVSRWFLPTDPTRVPRQHLVGGGVDSTYRDGIWVCLRMASACDADTWGWSTCPLMLMPARCAVPQKTKTDTPRRLAAALIDGLSLSLSAFGATPGPRRRGTLGRASGAPPGRVAGRGGSRRRRPGWRPPDRHEGDHQQRYGHDREVMRPATIAPWQRPSGSGARWRRYVARSDPSMSDSGRGSDACCRLDVVAPT
jgi:hypothetical protein